MGREGRHRCTPPRERRVDVVFLLFDTSGSMTDARRAQALACAHQYAAQALDGNAAVVVASFANGVHISEPARQMLDVEIALRHVTDPTQTWLPTSQLQPLFDRFEDAAADLVIISDGWFITNGDALNWYQYFLELNPDNRAGCSPSVMRRRPDCPNSRAWDSTSTPTIRFSARSDSPPGAWRASANPRVPAVSRPSPRGRP